MATMKDIIQSPLLLALVIGGLLYISAFSLVYLKKAYDHCLELGITRKELSNVIKSSLIFFRCAQPFHRGGPVRAHCGTGQRVGLVAAVGHRLALV